MRDFTHKINDNADPAIGKLDASEDNVRFLELETVTLASGIALDGAAGPDSRTNMLAESFTRHAGAAMACSDSGAANAYVLAKVGDYVAPTAFVDEFGIRFKPKHANTGASTLNAYGLGAKAIVDHTYAALTGGEIDGRDVELVYRASVGAGSWILMPWANAINVAPPTSSGSLTSGEGWTIDASNHGNLDFPALNLLTTLDASDLFARFVSAGGVDHHRSVTWAQMLAALTALTSGRIASLQFLTLTGTYTKTAGTLSALVIAVGGGGGGGGSTSSSGGAGGGAGGTAMAIVDLSSTSTVAVTVGAGGAAGSGAAGSAGGTTSFGSAAVASGGFGGAVNGVGGDGGVGTTGFAKLAGGPGNVVARSGCGAAGGSSFLGGGGVGGISATGYSPTSGTAGGNYGGGGGGAAKTTSAGAGAGGAILVLEMV